MSPKEKGKEIVERFLDYTSGVEGLSSNYDENVAYKNGIECALVLVDELISATSKGHWYAVKKSLLELRDDDLEEEEYPLIED